MKKYSESPFWVVLFIFYADNLISDGHLCAPSTEYYVTFLISQSRPNTKIFARTHTQSAVVVPTLYRPIHGRWNSAKLSGKSKQSLGRPSSVDAHNKIKERVFVVVCFYHRISSSRNIYAFIVCKYFYMLRRPKVATASAQRPQKYFKDKEKEYKFFAIQEILI